MRQYFSLLPVRAISQSTDEGKTLDIRALDRGIVCGYACAYRDLRFGAAGTVRIYMRCASVKTAYLSRERYRSANERAGERESDIDIDIEIERAVPLQHDGLDALETCEPNERVDSRRRGCQQLLEADLQTVGRRVDRLEILLGHLP